MIPKPLTRGFRIDSWTGIAVSIAVLVYLSLLALSVYFPELEARLVLLIVGLVFLGMPHGAMDIVLMSKLLDTRSKVFRFVGAYAGMALLVLLAWILSPTLSFVGFISYSLFHFADSDLQKNLNRDALTRVEFLARLPLPFCVPLIFFPAETNRLIGFIHPAIEFQSFALAFETLGYFGLAATFLFTAIGLYRFVTRFQNEDLTFLEPLVLVVLFSQLPPLYSLGIYFCFIHSMKHIVNVVRKIETKSIRKILPYWLLPLAGLPVLFFLYSRSQTYDTGVFQGHLFQYIMITLSAIALPHAVLVNHCKRRGLIN